ncbi:MAG TPA: RseA family anti-sigma factor [Burkholderiales bacterium]|nr:RseA family anti-sigma factor [Burkholderiales bacterium]
MTEHISALLDGELSDQDGLRQLEVLRSDEACRRTWATYHLIGDALRGDVQGGCARAVSRRLADEPVVLCPTVTQRVRRERTWYAVSAAAGFAAVAFVAWTAVPMLNARPDAQVAVRDATLPASASVAPAGAGPVGTAPAPVLASAPAAGTASITPGATAVAASQVPAPDVENYLLAHQQFSPSNAMQGVAPYVRLVSEESGR